MVKERITSALLTEGDADWDPRIRSQLESFAQASANLTNFVPNTGHPLAYSTSAPGSDVSPYGNDWDVLWLGTCGVEGEVFYTYPDETVAPYNKEYPLIQSQLDAEPFGEFDRLPRERIVTNVRNALCTYTYALSLRGAIKLAKISIDMDIMVDVFMSRKCGDGTLKCIAPWPAIMCDDGDKSDVGDHKDEGLREPTGGRILQYSTRVNAERIEEGKGIEEWKSNW